MAKSTAPYAGQPPDNGKSRQCEAGLHHDSVKTGRKKGDRCPRSAIAGCNVCQAHGGAPRHVKEAGLLRLARLADPGIDLLAGVIALDRRRVLAALRSKRADVVPDLRLGVNAVQDILDRIGYTAKQHLDITATTFAVDPKDLSDEDLRLILELKEKLAASGKAERKPGEIEKVSL